METIDIKYLKDFEKEVAKHYEAGKIRAPVHLRDGNEEKLIEYFNKSTVSSVFGLKNCDYYFSTWASHLHALLAGVPRDEIMSEILDGKSITLHFPKYNFYTSAIVGGVAPIAVGCAWGLKQRMLKAPTRVHCFLGDMAFKTGIVHESIMYAIGHDLPITFIVEDNAKSVCTDTCESWGTCAFTQYKMYEQLLYDRRFTLKNVGLYYYKYKCSYPHSSTGVFVEF